MFQDLAAATIATKIYATDNDTQCMVSAKIITIIAYFIFMKEQLRQTENLNYLFDGHKHFRDNYTN